MTRIINDNYAQLSLDFMAGLTLFLIAFLFLALFIPSMFVPFRSETVDLNSVAYRTSVILTEDPGWYNDVPNDSRGPDWENHVVNLSRVGLAVDKEHPNVLDRIKIDTFNNTALIDDTNLSTALGLFRRIGGNDIFYGYNITLEQSDGTVLASRGDPVPMSGNVVSVRKVALPHTRMEAYLEDGDSLEGASSPTKALFYINKSDVLDVLDEGIYITIKNFNFTGATPNQRKYSGVKIANSVISTANGYAISGGGTNNDPDGSSSLMDGGTGTYYYQGVLSPPGGKDINNEIDTLEIFMPRSVLDNNAPALTLDGTMDIHIELQFGSQIDVDPDFNFPPGTVYNDFKIPHYESAQLTIQVWS